MPKIREYQQQVEAPGALNFRRAQAEDMGIGQGLSQLGRGTTQLGETVAKRAEQNDISDLTAKVADAHVRLTKQLNDQIQNGTLKAEDFQRVFDDEMGKVTADASTYAGQQFATRMQAQLKEHFVEKAIAGQAHLAGEKAKANYLQMSNGLSTTLMDDPSQFALAKSMHDASLDEMVKSGGLPADAAAHLKVKGASDLAASAVRGWIKLNPEDAKAQLTAGKWNDLVSGDVKKQLFHESEMAINAKRIEAERLRAEQQRILGQKQLEVQDDFLKRIHAGTLSAKDILGSILDPVGSGSKKQFLDMLEASADSKLKTDPATFVELFRRIHADENDPKRILDENDLNPYLIGRRLSFEDLNKLRGELQGKKTTDGAIESELKKNVIKMAESSLTRSNPLSGMKDPVGDNQMGKFLSVFLTTYESEKKKGKTPLQLLNPDSPDYLGKLVGQFQRTPQQVMQDMAKMASGDRAGSGLASNPSTSPSPGASPSNAPSVTPSPAPSGDRARRPGESIQEYMKRVGK